MIPMLCCIGQLANENQRHLVTAFRVNIKAKAKYEAITLSCNSPHTFVNMRKSNHYSALGHCTDA